MDDFETTKRQASGKTCDYILNTKHVYMYSHTSTVLFCQYRGQFEGRDSRSSRQSTNEAQYFLPWVSALVLHCNESVSLVKWNTAVRLAFRVGPPTEYKYCMYKNLKYPYTFPVQNMLLKCVGVRQDSYGVRTS